MPPTSRPKPAKETRPNGTISGENNTPSIFLGIDPGIGGGLARIGNDKVITTPMPDTERGVWDWISHYQGSPDGVVAFIEKINPLFAGPNKASMSKLYGHYRMLRAFLVAARIRFEEITAVKWQQALSIPKRLKTESDSKWKNRLRQRAYELYPNEKITLAVSDALLIAEVCKRQNIGV